MRIVKATLIMLIASLLLGGCQVSGEVENLAYVLVLGVDRVPGGDLLLTARVPQIGKGKPNEQSGGGDYLVFSGLGADYPQALDALEQATPRRMNLSHIELIVAGRALAEEPGFGELIARVAETPHLYTTARFVVCEGRASEFVSAQQTVIGTRLSSEINAMLEHYARQGFIPDGCFADAYGAFVGIYGDAAAIYATLTPEEAPAAAMLDAEGSRDDRIQSPARQRYSGAALFRRGRMVGTLDAGQTRLLNLIRGSTEAFPFECDGRAFTLTPEGKARLTVRLDGGEASLSVMLRLSTLDDMCEEDAGTLERAMAQGILDLIRRCQALEAEPFGFSEIAAGRFLTVPAWLATNWRTAYARATVGVNVEIRRSEP